MTEHNSPKHTKGQNGGAKSKKVKKMSKSSMTKKASHKSNSGEVHGWCMKERMMKPMVDGKEVKKNTKKGRTMIFLMGTCKSCGGKLSKIMGNEKT